MTFPTHGHLDELVDTDPLRLRDEAVALLARAEKAERERDRFRQALELIGTRCEIYTRQMTCVDEPRRSPHGRYLHDRWCDGCISRDALDQPRETT